MNKMKKMNDLMANEIINYCEKNAEMKEWLYDDAATFELLQKGDTDGVFWLTSRFDKYDLQQVKPSSMEELEFVVAASYPSMNELIYPYLKNRTLRADGVYYRIPFVDEVLRPTNGVIVFKEQAEAVRNFLFDLPENHEFDKRAVAWAQMDVMKSEGHTMPHSFVEQRAKTVYKTAYMKVHMSDLYDTLYGLFCNSIREEECEEDEALIRLGYVDENVLVRSIKEGDEERLNRLVEDNMTFVTKVAKRFQQKEITLTELVEAGRKGLVEAAKRYEERDGYRFTSYAAWWVRQNIMLTIAYKKKFL